MQRTGGLQERVTREEREQAELGENDGGEGDIGLPIWSNSGVSLQRLCRVRWLRGWKCGFPGYSDMHILELSACKIGSCS